MNSLLWHLVAADWFETTTHRPAWVVASFTAQAVMAWRIPRTMRLRELFYPLAEKLDSWLARWLRPSVPVWKRPA